ncbi:MAG: hypothetical protein QNJ55_27365 [Xenococcus sp. MO_188.B8]|nr:hypothetical protein [Xenococcus sp. MO_188.B8]
MINKIPDIFERNFFIGYFLPTGVAILIFDLILRAFNLPSVLERFYPQNSSDILITTTFFSLISWIGGIVFLSINRELVRIFEGYGQFNPVRLLAFMERYYFRKLKIQIDTINRQYLKFVEEGKNYPADLNQRRNQLMQKAVTRFPAKEQWLLPTAFGNVIRAFETYSYLF